MGGQVAEQSKGKTIAFWILTGLVCVSQGASGVMDWIGHPEIIKGLTALGFPAYLAYILGTWKILGVVALAAPGFPRIKEWAYAGFFFDFTGAAASHLLNGDGPELFMPAMIATFILVGSYVLRPASRRLA